MISAILIIGNAGSGKSIIVWYLGSLLDEDGIHVRYISDRLGLEEAVEKDTARVSPDKNGFRTGAHSKFIADGPPGFKKVHVLDGRLLNKVHDNMIGTLAKNKNKKHMLLMEYAIGPDIQFGKGKEPLLQSIKHIVSNLQKRRLIQNVFVIDIEAPYDVREAREQKRRDAMAAETFRAYFPDGGEITKKDQQKLGTHYARFNNSDEDNQWCYSEIKYLYEKCIRPKVNPKLFF